MTLNLYKQKIKHLLLINQDQQSELRKDVEITLKQLEDEHRIKERALKTDTRSLHVMLKEQELSQEDYTFALKAENDKRQTELRQEFERKANDLKKKYDLKMLKVRSEMENHRKQLIKALEEKKDEKIKKLTSEHTKKYSDIKAYYTEITATNLDLIKTLRNEITALHKKEDEDKRLLNQIERERKELTEPYKQLEIDIKRYQEDIKKQDAIINEKKKIKADIDILEEKFRDLEYQY
jgi:growth arrest-specific protein 8